MSLNNTTDAGTTVASSWAVVQAFETRLIAGMTAAGKPSAGYVRIGGLTDAKDAGAYKAEEGVHIFVGDERPVKNDGASRYGKRVSRVFEVHIVTVSNQDRAGEFRIAAEKHLNVEDILFNVMDGTPPYEAGDPVPWNVKIGITCEWIAGGDAIKRGKRIDPSRFVSIHLFEVKYPQKMQKLAGA